jgi:hypothetical protein
MQRVSLWEFMLREGPWIGQLPLTTCELLPTHRG